jgi:chromosome segregation ATPase
VNTIIAAIIVGIIVLWGGVLALLRMVDLYERKHILGLGAYTTLVAGLIMGLVLFNAYERQKEHRRELQDQMTAVTQRLSELSERLVGQLAEKADLTQSEFEIRGKLQKEQALHERTRGELAGTRATNRELEQELAKERAAHKSYQEDQNRKLAERLRLEEERYQGLREFLQAHQETIQRMQKQLASLQGDASRLQTQVSGLTTNQNSLLGKVDASREVQDLNVQKVEALARSQAALYDDLLRTMAQVDSLYTWKKK